MERRSDRLNSPHETSPEAQLLTRHLTSEVVAQVGLRPTAAEAATGAHTLVQPEARPVSGQLEPPGRPPAQSTPQSAEPTPLVAVTAPLAVVTAPQSAEPAQLSSAPAPITAVPATLPAGSALRATGSVLRSAESAPVLWCELSGVPAGRACSHS